MRSRPNGGSAAGRRTSLVRGTVTLDELDGVAVAPGNHRVLFENGTSRARHQRSPWARRRRSHSPRADRAVPVVGFAASSAATSTARRCSTRATDPEYVMPRCRSTRPCRGTPSRTPAMTISDLIGVELKHPGARLAAMDADAPILPPDLVAGFRRFRRTRYRGGARALPAPRDGGPAADDDGRRLLRLAVRARDGLRRAARRAVRGPQRRRRSSRSTRRTRRSHAASAALEFAVLALGVRPSSSWATGAAAGSRPRSTTAAPLTRDRLHRHLGRAACATSPPSWTRPTGRTRRAAGASWSSARSSSRSSNLRTFPWIRSREQAGHARRSHGAWFDIGAGRAPGAVADDGWAPSRGAALTARRTPVYDDRMSADEPTTAAPIDQTPEWQALCRPPRRRSGTATCATCSPRTRAAPSA